jgi:beta-1,4-N-acetylglucosaminyltransferase
VSDGPRVLLVCAPGADLQQLLMLAPAWQGLEYRWVTPRAPDTEHELAGEPVTYADGRTDRGLWMLGRNALLARAVLHDFTPDVVLGTGAALALPFLLGSRLRGGRAVYVESVARVHELSPAGRLVYPFASAAFVQSLALQARRPRARYAGSVL